MVLHIGLEPITRRFWNVFLCHWDTVAYVDGKANPVLQLLSVLFRTRPIKHCHKWAHLHLCKSHLRPAGPRAASLEGFSSQESETSQIHTVVILRLIRLNPVFPLTYRTVDTHFFTSVRHWSGIVGSNHWPPICKNGALPAELNPDMYWWTLWESNPPVILLAREATTPCTPKAHISQSISRVIYLLSASTLLSWSTEPHRIRPLGNAKVAPQ